MNRLFLNSGTSALSEIRVARDHGKLRVWNKKRGKFITSHRYNRLPLLPSGSGGVQQELVVQDLPHAKVRILCYSTHQFCLYFATFVRPIHEAMTEEQNITTNEEPLAPFMNKVVGRNALNWGLLTGGVLVVFSLLLYVFDMTTKQGVSSLSYVLLIGGIVYAIYYYKFRVNSGFLSIGKGIATGTLVALYSGLIASAFAAVLIHYIDPGLLDQMKDLAEEEMLRRNPDLGDAELEMALGISEKMMKPIPMVVMGAIWYVVAGLIVSLIASAIMKKEPTPFNG
jgi:hypothetical protein